MVNHHKRPTTWEDIFVTFSEAPTSSRKIQETRDVKSWIQAGLSGNGKMEMVLIQRFTFVLCCPKILIKGLGSMLHNYY